MNCIPGIRWLYMSIVILILACPSLAWTIFGCAPSCRRNVAWPCRKSWKRCSGIFAFLHFIRVVLEMFQGIIISVPRAKQTERFFPWSWETIWKRNYVSILFMLLQSATSLTAVSFILTEGASIPAKHSEQHYPTREWNKAWAEWITVMIIPEWKAFLQLWKRNFSIGSLLTKWNGMQ